MADTPQPKHVASGITRRTTLLAGAGLAAAGALQEAAQNSAKAQDASAFYPPVTPGIEPTGEKVQPYTAACVQSSVVPTFDASGNFLPDALKHNVGTMCDLIKRGAEEYGARLM